MFIVVIILHSIIPLPTLHKKWHHLNALAFINICIVFILSLPF